MSTYIYVSYPRKEGSWFDVSPNAPSQPLYRHIS